MRLIDIVHASKSCCHQTYSVQIAPSNDGITSWGNLHQHDYDYDYIYGDYQFRTETCKLRQENTVEGYDSVSNGRQKEMIQGR